MKATKHLIYLTLLVFISTQCSNEESVEISKPPYNVDLKFNVDGVDQIVTVRFVYDSKQKHYELDSDLIVEVNAVNEVTKEKMLGYYLKKTANGRVPVPMEMGIETGYVGYSPSDGCWYYGTLYTADNGDTAFVPATDITAIMNPPMCGYYYA